MSDTQSYNPEVVAEREVPRYAEAYPRLDFIKAQRAIREGRTICVCRGAGRLLPTRLGLAAPIVVVLHFAAIMALWIYALPLALRAGLTTASAGFALSLAFGYKQGGLVSAARIDVIATVREPLSYHN